MAISGSAPARGLWLLLAAVSLVPTLPAVASEPAVRSSWVTKETSRTRLVAGEARGPDGAKGVYAGIEIALEDGWKTYWRNPGYSGVPPFVDTAGSENIAEAKLLFPAPTRFQDRDGDTIGYKHSVVLPLALSPKDPSKPMMLKVSAEFGICKDVCIPVQPTLSLDVPAGADGKTGGAALQEALDRVPMPPDGRPQAPRIDGLKIDLQSAKPSITIDAAFPQDPQSGDVFLEAPDGAWIPLPKAGGETPEGGRRFVVDLSDGADIADLKGRTIRATLVSAKGQSETTFKLE